MSEGKGGDRPQDPSKRAFLKLAGAVAVGAVIAVAAEKTGVIGKALGAAGDVIGEAENKDYNVSATGQKAAAEKVRARDARLKAAGDKAVKEKAEADQIREKLGIPQK